MDLGEYCLLDRLPRGVLDNGPSCLFCLDCGAALCLLLLRAVIQVMPEVPLLLPLYNRANFLDGFLVLAFLCHLKPVVQMLPLVLLSVLLEEDTFLLAFLQSVVGLRDG